MSVNNCCYVGRGEIKIKPYVKVCTVPPTVDTNSFISLGNVSKFEIVPEEKEISKGDYTKPPGAQACYYKLTEKVKVKLTIECFKDLNIKIAGNATSSQIATGTVTDELHAVSGVDVHIPTNFIASAITSVDLGAAGGPYSTNLVLGTDYELTPTGIHILPNSPVVGAATLPAELAIDYTKAAQDQISLFANPAQEYVVWLDGFNAQNTGEKLSAKLWKVSFGAFSNLNLISDDFISFEIEGVLLADECKAAGNQLAEILRV